MPTGKPNKMKACAICGDMFLPDKPSSRICSKQHYQKCPICGKQVAWNTTRKMEPCSKECRKENRRRLNLEKYGVEHPMQSKEVQKRHKQAMLEKYGVESPLQSEEIRQRAIATNREKFGSDWALGSDTIIEKSRQTMINRYGAPTTLQSEELSQKVKKTMIERYGEHVPTKVDSIRQRIADTNIIKYGYANPMSNSDICLSAMKTRIEHYGSFWPKEIDEAAKQTFLERYGVDNPSKSIELMERAKHVCMERYGVPYGCLVPSAQQPNRISSYNKKLHDLLATNNVDSEFEFYLSGKFYDLHITGTNTLIEIDPSYTHNVIGNHWSNEGLDKYYHRDKSEVASDNGYRCIHVFDWDDWGKIVDLLKPRKRIYARDLKVYKLNNSVADKFLNDYHLQGTCRGQLLWLGLVKDNVLYQVMTFGKSRYDKNHYVELLRLCTKPGYTVVGGASKLFSYATSEFGLHSIISYCDRSKFTGDVYEKIGMKLLRKTPPQEVWSKGDRKITANLLRQRGYDQLFGTSYGKGYNNEKLMLENGWLPVYDCGQLVYEFQ